MKDSSWDAKAEKFWISANLVKTKYQLDVNTSEAGIIKY